MQRHYFAPYILCAAIAANACVAADANDQESSATFHESPGAVDETGCRTGGSAVANAYLLINPLYAHFFGSLESYIANNAEHFRPNGDAIRCASALSTAFLQRAIQLYDPSDNARRAELNAQLGAMGISPGPQESSASGDAFGVSMQLSRLARVLPAAAEGDYGPFWTPTNQLEEMQIAAIQILRLFMQNPEVASIIAQLEPMIRELANLEYRAIEQAAASLANSD